MRPKWYPSLAERVESPGRRLLPIAPDAAQQSFYVAHSVDRAAPVNLVVRLPTWYEFPIMTIDRGSSELVEPIQELVVCGDAVVTVRTDVLGRAEVLEAGTLKLYGRVRGDLEVNTSGRVDIHGIVEGELRVSAGDVRVIGSVGAVSGSHAKAVKLCSGCLVAGQRQY